MNQISFFTAVDYGAVNKTFPEQLLEFCDNYFFINGQKAQVVPFSEFENNRLVTLNNQSTDLLKTTLKIISYCTVIIPAIVFLAKLILRSCYHFYLARTANPLGALRDTTPPAPSRAPSIDPPQPPIGDAQRRAFEPLPIGVSVNLTSEEVLPHQIRLTLIPQRYEELIFRNGADDATLALARERVPVIQGHIGISDLPEYRNSYFIVHYHEVRYHEEGEEFDVLPIERGPEFTVTRLENFNTYSHNIPASLPVDVTVNLHAVRDRAHHPRNPAIHGIHRQI